MPHPLPSPADLHLHSSRSDGMDAPGDVVRHAAAAGIGTIALTDHDTVDGWPEAALAARACSAALIPGTELSSKHRGWSVHVLGYLVDPSDAALGAIMDRVRGDRVHRARRLAENVSRDHPITWADVLAQRAGDATVGRPHIADALVAAGVVPRRDDAFAKILHPGGPYYVGHTAPSPLEVVRAIVGAGGVAIIAHPAGRGMLPDPAIRALLDAGLHGFELGHRENTRAGVDHLRRIVGERDLIVTGSSDYHGAAGKPNVIGENTTSPNMVERIVAAARGSDPVV